MVGKLERLPVPRQRILQELACLGNSAEFSRLALVHEGSDEELRHDLHDALQTELVVPAEGSYRFLRDRVPGSRLLPDCPRLSAPQRIFESAGCTDAPPAENREAIFEIVNQLNRGIALITSRDQKEQLAELNLIAGKRAKVSTAYVSALNYLVAGTAPVSTADGTNGRT